MVGRRPGIRLRQFALGLMLAACSAPGPDQDDATGLIAATARGDLGVVEHLLHHGAAPDAHDRRRNTALIFAARDGRLEVAAALIEHGATVDWIDGEGVTPLILAAFRNHPEVVDLLLAQGADPTIRDQWGRNARDYARRRGDDDPIARRLSD